MKRELIVGTIILMLLALFLIDSFALVARYEPIFDAPLFSRQIDQFIGWFATLDTIFLIALIAWRAHKKEPSIERLIQRFTIKATIPGYFIFALSPIGVGIVLIAITGQLSWGTGIAALSFPALLLFLYLELRKS
jgi:hypothetical protein